MDERIENKEMLINPLVDQMKDDEFSIEEFSIIELEDRLEFVLRCDNRCN